jgi:ferredoxin
MTHVITSLCLRDSACVEVCPVECIVPGKPIAEWPLFYIDPDTCIDCGACVAECPYEAIFPETDVPQAFVAGGGEYLSMPMPTKEGVTPKRESLPGFKLTTLEDEGITIYGRVLDEGEVVNLNDSSVSQGTKANAAYFKTGSGYNALNM